MFFNIKTQSLAHNDSQAHFSCARESSMQYKPIKALNIIIHILFIIKFIALKLQPYS